MVVATRISRPSSLLGLDDLPSFAMWPACPIADSSEGSVARGLAPRRRSRFSSRAYVLSATEVARSYRYPISLIGARVSGVFQDKTDALVATRPRRHVSCRRGGHYPAGY
jgi:hypothetical protein